MTRDHLWSADVLPRAVVSADLVPVGTDDVIVDGFVHFGAAEGPRMARLQTRAAALLQVKVQHVVALLHIFGVEK